MVRAGAGAGFFDKLEPEPDKNGPVPNTAGNTGTSCFRLGKRPSQYRYRYPIFQAVHF
jgi:hypothetical protein